MLKVVINWMVKSHIIPSTPRTFKPIPSKISSSIPPPSPNPSTSRPALASPLRPCLIPQPRFSPIITSRKPQPLTNSSRRREERSPLLFPAAQVFQRREQWPVRVTQEAPNMENEGQDSMARLFGRVDTNSREVIKYVNDGMIPGTTSEEMAAKFIWYEDELINDFQSTSGDIIKYN
ncbi:hypothetical protein O181_016066 [Austropuccinia psidii MF-1]|uniref:Uncharacterized protein n=1 Tax=Austropuccinia psidii MF-1 TaxID=1389203 RepID=A0A9Q3GQP4_9BASI|nr:hypothetical protein [Austropuccinia psidii MF-1]